MIRSSKYCLLLRAPTAARCLLNLFRKDPRAAVLQVARAKHDARNDSSPGIKRRLLRGVSETGRVWLFRDCDYTQLCGGEAVRQQHTPQHWYSRLPSASRSSCGKEMPTCSHIAAEPSRAHRCELAQSMSYQSWFQVLRLEYVAWKTPAR